MKQICFLILFFLLLAGCDGRELPPETLPTETVRATLEATRPETQPSLPLQPESDEAVVGVLDFIPTDAQQVR